MLRNQLPLVAKVTTICDFNKLFTSSIVGGQGQDSLILSDIGSAVGVRIAADALDRSNTTANGNDSIYISGALRTSTILGGAGNDSLTIALTAASGNTIYLDAGNDHVSATDGTDITDTTSTGAGDDKFVLADTGEVNSGTKLIMLVLTPSLFHMAGDLYPCRSDIEGGAGADYLFDNTNIATGLTAEPLPSSRLQLIQLSVYDTIALDADGSDESATYVNFVPGGLKRGTFSGDDVVAGLQGYLTGTLDALLPSLRRLLSRCHERHLCVRRWCW